MSDWLLPSEGRLSLADLQLFGRLAELLPREWTAALVQPSRSERRALPRFKAVSLPLQAPGVDVLVAARLPGFGSESEAPFRAARRGCRLLVVLDQARPPGATDSERSLQAVRLASDELRCYRGELCDPLLRVDDYPSGVRPILEDLTPLHDVLRRIDDSGLTFHLGIVPAIVEDRMQELLRSLRHLVVSMHGFEHGYAKLSRVLLEAGDPFNQRGTVGGFDEFEGAAYDEILRTLERGRQLLQARTGQLALSYIPPTNKGNRRTGRALEQLGFEYVLSERPLPGCKLPSIASDFYDRSSKLGAGARPRVASLHATWEADLVQGGDRESLPRFLSKLSEQRREDREQLAAVVAGLASGLGRG
ncbi:MAG TPA: hypothetical protein VIW29_08240 [Polyangiaceae bacterium]